MKPGKLYRCDHSYLMVFDTTIQAEKFFHTTVDAYDDFGRTRTASDLDWFIARNMGINVPEDPVRYIRPGEVFMLLTEPIRGQQALNSDLFKVLFGEERIGWVRIPTRATTYSIAAKMNWKAPVLDTATRSSRLNISVPLVLDWFTEVVETEEKEKDHEKINK